MTVEVRIESLRRRKVASVTGILFGHGALGTQEDWMPGETPDFVQPWEERPDPVPQRVLLRAWFETLDAVALVRALVQVGVAGFGIYPVDEVDWQASFEAQHEPIVISDRLTVAPPWNAPEGALIIEPGSGFGTGTHPTTRLALQCLDRLADDHHTLLDVGTGSGVLALAGAKLGLTVRGIDHDDDAIADARRQQARNGLPAELDTTPVDRVPGTFDLVLANLDGPLLVRLADALVARTGHTLFVTGLLEEHEADVVAAFGALSLVSRTADPPWVGLQLTCTTS